MKKEDKLLVAFPFGCNMDCLFCLRNDRTAAAQPRLSKAQWRLRLYKLQALMRLLRKKGGKSLFLGGDEPTAAPVWLLDAVIALARKERFPVIEMRSNGIKFRNKAYLARLVGAGVNSFYLPVYGATAGVHDRITQKKGSYAALLRAIKNIRALPGVALQMHTMRLKFNQAEFGAIVPGMRKLGLGCEIGKLRERKTDPKVNYRALEPDGYKPPVRPAGDSRDKKGGSFFRYNIRTGEIF